ncbi:hypothetical protein AN403_4139 [Pseudomonas fluorescens]|uniref:Uncharacterized protein n=1 Tax=Pseudomonas fluorescens TaxID=294 RepID=A0A0P9BC53_PSEFL|nr:hypothetical protein AN403_4139 [Pseudomonas fluorescens]
MNQKRAIKGPFLLNLKSPGQPRLDSARAVFSFPLFQRFVIATFGFDNFAGVRVFVDLNLAWLAAAGFRFGCWSATARMWIKQVDHVFQAVAILGQQRAKLRFEFDFFLEASIVFQGFESLVLLGEVFLKLTEFCEFGQSTRFGTPSADDYSGLVNAKSSVMDCPVFNRPSVKTQERYSR